MPSEGIEPGPMVRGGYTPPHGIRESRFFNPAEFTANLKQVVPGAYACRPVRQKKHASTAFHHLASFGHNAGSQHAGRVRVPCTSGHFQDPEDSNRCLCRRISSRF